MSWDWQVKSVVARPTPVPTREPEQPWIGIGGWKLRGFIARTFCDIEARIAAALATEIAAQRGRTMEHVRR